MVKAGREFAACAERAEQIDPLKGIPVFGLDALGSAAYSPEAALTLLIPLGLAWLKYIVPLSASIIVLPAIVCFLTGKQLALILQAAALLSWRAKIREGLPGVCPHLHC